MSLQCKECQHINPAGSKYCNECGAPLSTEKPETANEPGYSRPEFEHLSRHIQDFKFRHNWRPYQKRVLDAIEDHLDDDKLHVVAAPGSGKTTLGIEVFWRIGRPALVLSPTRTIRDQWVVRLKDFLPKDAKWPLQWTSKYLDELKLFNSITYQALHTLFRKDEDSEAIEPEENGDTAASDSSLINKAPSKKEVENLIVLLHAAKIGTLILDEAHHLRSAWWKALAYVVEVLPYIKLVSLTATPPYDVSGHEWKKYHDLCGPIDEEISVPELVRSGTLCPHQDFVWTVVPLKNEAQHVEEYQRSVYQICGQLLEDRQFLGNIQNHAWVTQEMINPDELLENPSQAIALLVYLKEKQQPLPQQLTALLDMEPADVPAINRHWWQTLVKFYLFHKSWGEEPGYETHRNRLAQELRAKHLLWRRELRLTESRLVKSKLTLSSSKINACLRIHEIERQLRGHDLRQVILTDYIRDRYDNSNAGKAPLGAWPIFSALVDELGMDAVQDLALLTGRLVVIHSSRLERLTRIAKHREISHQPLDQYSQFVRVTVNRGSIVPLITELFVGGDVHVLVGTRALLGEGWDAPCVNSLILASFVGSFMLTNQMRGRAIRVDKQKPDKVSSIWHIVAVFARSWAGLADLFELQQRFTTFVGLNASENAIESGLARLNLPYYTKYNQLKPQNIDEHNNNSATVQRLRSIDNIAERWLQAVEKGEAHTVVPTIKTSKPPRRSPLLFKNTLKYLLLEILAVFVVALFIAVDLLRAAPNLAIVLLILAVAMAGAALFTLPKLIKAARLYFWHLPVDGTIRQMGLAVRDALFDCGLIKTPKVHATLSVNHYEDGSVSIGMRGGSFYEQSVFVDAMEEVLSAIENPRYLLTRQSDGNGPQRVDFHAVPAILGIKKERAETLQRAWEHRVGPTELIYVRGVHGRGLLLKARSKASANAFVSDILGSDILRYDRWH